MDGAKVAIIVGGICSGSVKGDMADWGLGRESSIDFERGGSFIDVAYQKR